MSKIILSLLISWSSIHILYAQNYIGLNAGITNYGSQFVDKIEGTNWKNQNNKSYEYSINYLLCTTRKRDYEVRIGYTNRIIDNVENATNFFELNQDYLAVNLFTHRRMALLPHKFNVGIGGGVFANILLNETKKDAEIGSLSKTTKEFGSICRVGLMADIPFEILLKRRTVLVIGTQLGFDVLSNLKSSNLIYYNHYLGIRYELSN